MADKDLLYLIREEEIYAKRIREALLFSEDEFIRADVLVLDADDSDMILKVETTVVTPGGNDNIRLCKKQAHTSSESSFLNPSINIRRTVDDKDGLYSSSVQRAPLEFSYADLIALQKGTGKKRIDARTLRRVANLWGIDPKLRKSEMIVELLIQYARQFPEEVAMTNIHSS